MGVLCIIDVQPGARGYAAARNPKLIEEILNQIDDAKTRRDIITVTTFSGCGPTDRSIVDAVKNYDKVHYTIKYECDGSPGIYDALSQYSSITIETIHVCGVYTHICVKATANGLARKMAWATVTVLENASNDTLKEYPLGMTLAIRRYHNIKNTPKNLKTRKRRKLESSEACPMRRIPMVATF